MKRIDTATKAVDLFGAGKHGFKDGNKALGIPATDLDAALFNNVQEEICRVIEAAGIALDGAVYNQLLLALRAAGVFTTPAQFDNGTKAATTAFVKRFGMNHYLPVSFSASGALNASDCIGNLIIAYANTGPITFTLPSSAACPQGGAISFLNASPYNVTLARYGADEINPANGNLTSVVLAPGDTFSVSLFGAVWEAFGGSACLAYAGSFAKTLAANGYQKLPSGLIIQWGQATGTSSPESITFPVAFPTACRLVLLTPYYVTAAVAGYASVQAKSVTGFTMYKNNTTFGCDWVAIGN